MLFFFYFSWRKQPDLFRLRDVSTAGGKGTSFG
jgi:hypothetical protein